MTTSDVKYCQECGKENPIDQKFCGECGISFDEPSKPKMTTEEKSGFALGIVSLVLSILGFSCLPILGSIGAIITGFMTTDRKNNNFAKAGIIIGFVTIGLGILIFLFVMFIRNA